MSQRNELPSIAEVAAGLARRAEAVVVWLLPAGVRSGREWLVGSVDGEPGKSLHVQLVGDRAGQWRDFAASHSGGDLVDLIAAVNRVDLGEAWQWAIDWLGWRERKPEPAMWRKPAVSIDPLAERARRSAAAFGVYLAARPTLAGTPAEDYLLGRGIDLRALGRQPAALRYHPELFNSGRYWPALVALIQDPLTGKPMGLHRTYLHRDSAGKVRKAPVEAPKRVLGAMRGGFIPLARGASGKPLSEAPSEDVLAVTEGIEDALTIALAEPAWRVAALVCVRNFLWTRWPTHVRRIRLCADNDRPGSEAAGLLSEAAAALAGSGREVQILRPPKGCKDFNALLCDSLA